MFCLGPVIMTIVIVVRSFYGPSALGWAIIGEWCGRGLVLYGVCVLWRAGV